MSPRVPIDISLRDILHSTLPTFLANRLTPQRASIQGVWNLAQTSSVESSEQTLKGINFTAEVTCPPSHKLKKASAQKVKPRGASLQTAKHREHDFVAPMFNMQPADGRVFVRNPRTEPLHNSLGLFREFAIICASDAIITFRERATSAREKATSARRRAAAIGQKTLAAVNALRNVPLVTWVAKAFGGIGQASALAGEGTIRLIRGVQQVPAVVGGLLEINAVMTEEMGESAAILTRSLGKTLLQNGVACSVKILANAVKKSPYALDASALLTKKTAAANRARIYSLASKYGDLHFPEVINFFIDQLVQGILEGIPKGEKLSAWVDSLLEGYVDAQTIDRKWLCEEILELSHLEILIRANIVKMLANTAEEAMCEAVLVGQARPQVLTATIVFLSNVADKHMRRLHAELAGKGSLHAKENARRRALESLADELLGTAFPAGESDVEVEHSVLPQGLLRKLIWKLLKRQTALGFRKLYDPFAKRTMAHAQNEIAHKLPKPLYPPKKNISRLCQVAGQLSVHAIKGLLADTASLTLSTQAGLRATFPKMENEMRNSMTAYAAQVGAELTNGHGATLHKNLEKLVENMLLPPVTTLITKLSQKEQAHLGEVLAGIPKHAQSKNQAVAVWTEALRTLVVHLEIINQARGPKRDALREDNYTKIAQERFFIKQGLLVGDSQVRAAMRHKIYAPLAEKIFNYAHLKSADDLSSVPPALRQIAWKQLQGLKPTILGSALEAGLNHATLLDMLIAGLQSLNLALQTPGVPPLPPCSAEEAALDKQCGAMMAEVLKLIPFPLGLERFVSAESIGQALALSAGAGLRQELNGEYFSKMLHQALINEIDLSAKTPKQAAAESAQQAKALHKELHTLVDLLIPQLYATALESICHKGDTWIKNKLGKPGQVIEAVLGFLFRTISTLINLLTLGLMKKGAWLFSQSIARNYLYKYANRTIDVLEGILKGPLPPQKGDKDACRQGFSDVHLNALLHAAEAIVN